MPRRRIPKCALCPAVGVPLILSATGGRGRFFCHDCAADIADGLEAAQHPSPIEQTRAWADGLGDRAEKLPGERVAVEYEIKPERRPRLWWMAA